MIEREVEQTGAGDSGPCDCHGSMTRTVWGFVHRGDETEAAYFVQWSVGAVDAHGASFDLMLGGWNDAPEEERTVISIAFRRTDEGPRFIIVDADDTPAARSDPLSKALKRDVVVGTPLAKTAFDIVEQIWMKDTRIGELTLGAMTTIRPRFRV